jgi:hypothetical protein
MISVQNVINSDESKAMKKPPNPGGKNQWTGKTKYNRGQIGVRLPIEIIKKIDAQSITRTEVVEKALKDFFDNSDKIDPSLLLEAIKTADPLVGEVIELSVIKKALEILNK